MADALSWAAVYPVHSLAVMELHCAAMWAPRWRRLPPTHGPYLSLLSLVSCDQALLDSAFCTSPSHRVKWNFSATKMYIFQYNNNTANQLNLAILEIVSSNTFNVNIIKTFTGGLTRL